MENKREKLMEENVTELKDYFKKMDVRPPAGYWKMTKEDMIEEIIKYEEDNSNSEKIEKDVKEMEDNKTYAAETELEVKEDEKVEEKELQQTKDLKREVKHIFKAINPDGEVKFQSEKLNDVVDYSMENGIASRGWVALSIKRDIPVMIGLGRDQELTEDFVPRTTSKYNGNYWKFTKEEVKPS